MRLRIAILSVVTTLVTVSLILVGTYLGASNFELAESLQTRNAHSVFSNAEAELNTTFGKASNLLDKYATHIFQNSIDPGDPDLFAGYLASELRSEPSLTWLSIGYRRTGAFVGATRRDGNIIINMSIPERDSGRTREWIVDDEGRVSDIETPNAAPYDSRQTSWFKQGYFSRGVSWSEPYSFRDGENGISALRRVIGEEDKNIIGVMTADFGMGAITEQLNVISSQFPGDLLLAIHGKTDTFITENGTDVPMRDLIKSIVDGMESPASAVNELTLQLVDFQGKTFLLYTRPQRIVEGLDASLVYVLAQNASASGLVYTRTVTGAGFIVVLIAAAISVAMVISRSVAQPIERLGTAARDISFDDLTAYMPLQKHWLKEVDDTGMAFNGMVDRLQKEASMRSSFGRYLPKALASALEDGTLDIELGGTEIEITAMFTDIENFTHITEQLGSKRMIDYLNRYFAVVLEEVEDHDGVIIDFIGDGLFAAFGAPVPRKDHRDQAIACALKVIERTEAFEAELEDELVDWGRTRIGLDSGKVIAGNVGGAGRQKYTALGDVVNAAARIESLNKQLGTRFLASGQAIAGTAHAQRWRRAGRFVLVGQSEPVDIYEAVGPEFSEERQTAFEACLEASGDPFKAYKLFRAYLKDYGEDQIAEYHASRVARGEASDTVLLTDK